MKRAAIKRATVPGLYWIAMFAKGEVVEIDSSLTYSEALAIARKWVSA